MRLVRNFLFLSGGEVLSKLLTFVAIAFAARIAGPTGFGYLEFAASVVLLAGLLVHQGFGLYGAREIAKDPSSTDRLVAEIVSIRYVLAGLGYIGLILFVYWVDRPSIVERLVLLYGLSLLVMPLGLQWVFQGHERMNVSAGLQITRQTVFAIVILSVFRDPLRLWPVAIAEVAGAAAVAAGSILLYRRHFGRHVPLPSRISSKVVREGSMIGLSRVFWSLRISGAMVVFGLIATEQDLGFFGAALRILVGLYVFVWLYFINLLPSLSRDWNGGTGAFRERIDRSMHVVGWLSLGAGMFWVLLAPLAIRLVYGNAFAPAVPALQCLAAVCVIAAIHGHYRFALLAAGRQRDEMITSALGTTLSLPLIPLGYASWGLTGAAAALVLAELVIWLTSWLFARRYLRLGSLARYLVVPVISTALLLAVSWQILTPRLPIGVTIAIVAVGLAIAALATDREARRALGILLDKTRLRTPGDHE